MAQAQMLRVVVVERQRFFREQLARLFSETGFEVVGQYAEPAACLAQMAADAPGVLVADVSRIMTAEEEATFLESLKGLYPHVKCLLLGEAARHPAQRLYEAGAAGFLDAAETSTQAMLQAVRAVASGERLFPLESMPSPGEASHQAQGTPLLQELSHREKQVLSYVAAGADNLKIATLLQISERTVKAHMSKLYQKLQCENRTQLALLALQQGIRPSAEV